MNRVTLLGRLGKDPETRTSQAGKAVTKFSLATDRGWGEKKTTDWHACVCFDKTAEIAAKFLAKGRQVAVEGCVSYRKWDKDDGTTANITEILVDRLELISDRGAAAAPAEEKREPIAAEDLPF